MLCHRRCYNYFLKITFDGPACSVVKKTKELNDLVDGSDKPVFEPTPDLWTDESAPAACDAQKRKKQLCNNLLI